MTLNPNSDFVEFIEAELEKRGWNWSSLARHAGMSTGTLSNIVTGGRTPGPETCNSIARALKLSPSLVFVKAGIMDPDPNVEYSVRARELMLNFDSLSSDDQTIVIYLVKLMREKRTP